MNNFQKFKEFRNRRGEIAKESETLGRIETAKKYGLTTSTIDRWRRDAGVSKIYGNGQKKRRIKPLHITSHEDVGAIMVGNDTNIWRQGFLEGFKMAMSLLKENK